MTVHCPHCATGYELPDHLLGPGGGRVRCPSCDHAFVVAREGGGAPVAPPPLVDPARASQPSDPGALAARLLDELAVRLGENLARARAGGRVMAEFGPDLMEAYDEYRRRLGVQATREAFRQALRERWAVDLGSGPEPPEG